MEKLRFEIRQRETGLVIEAEKTLQEAKKTLELFEVEDKENNEYEEDYYEIYDSYEEETLNNTDLM